MFDWKEEMIEANYFENTQKSILNTASIVLDFFLKKREYVLEDLIARVCKKLDVPYEKVILALNFLYAIGKIEFDEEKKVLTRIGNEVK